MPAAFFAVFAACKKSNTVFKELAVSQTGIDFVNQLTCIDTLTILGFEYSFSGAEVAIIDTNGVGLHFQRLLITNLL